MQFVKDDANMRRVKEELADVAIYCLSMANALKIDVSKAVLEKIEASKKKYPPDLCRGKAHPRLARFV